MLVFFLELVQDQIFFWVNVAEVELDWLGEKLKARREGQQPSVEEGDGEEEKAEDDGNPSKLFGKLA